MDTAAPMYQCAQRHLLIASVLAACCALAFSGCDSGGGGTDVSADMPNGDAGGETDNSVSDVGDVGDTGGEETTSPDADMTVGDVDGDAPGDTTVGDGDVADSMDGDTFVPGSWPDGLPIIQLDASGHGETSGTFADGMAMSDHEWARSSSVGCWDNTTEDEFFSQNVILYGVEPQVDGWSDVTVTVTPDGNHEANLFVLEMGGNQFDVPPAVTSARGCFTHLGGPGAASTRTFRIHSDDVANLLVGIGNRGRFNNDDSGGYDIVVDVTPVAEADRCYAELPDLSGWPEHVNMVALDADDTAVQRGDLADGAPPCNLDYMEEAFCTPAIHNELWEGNHVFYAIDGGVPAESVVTITVTPDPGVDVNLYGSFQGLGTGFATPPAYPVTNCEADPATYLGERPGVAESITFVAPNGFNIFFAVAGSATQGDSGAYTISIERISTSTDNCTEADYNAVQGLEDWPTSVNLIDATSGSATVGPENTADGTPPCTLDWASSSQTACFPETDVDYFSGNTQYYALTEPPPAGSTVTFTVTPAPNTDVSIFGYRLGEDAYLVPPHVPVVGQCEASYHREVFTKTTDPGAVEEIVFYNPGGNTYNYFLGVAAFKDNVDGGAYRVGVEVDTPPPPHCTESLPGAQYPTWPGNVNLISVDASGQGSFSGDLANGACTNLEWAAQSDVACFPATRFDRFEGNHVFHALAEPIPPRSEVAITITPASASDDVNAYGLLTGTTGYPVPPGVISAITCDASYPIDVGTATNPGEAETLFFSNPSDTNMYNLMIGVAGPTGVSSAGYDIDVQITTEVTHCSGSLPGQTGLTQWPSEVTEVSFDGNGEFSMAGDLNTGSCTNLDWAEDSAIACFPATRFDRFEGSHNFYALAQPLPPESTLTIFVEPDPGVDVNLYGYQAGTDAYYVPPAMQSVVACEASYGLSGDNPGEVEAIYFANPSATSSYNIFFGVAGPTGTDAGGYTIGGSIVTAATHCPESLPGETFTNWPSNVRRVDLDDSTGTASINGNIMRGSCTNLEFADDSSVACFPATEFSSFEGSHRYHVIEDPLEPGFQYDISVTAAGGAPLSVYGYQIGLQSFYVPPAVPSVVACEYDLDPGAGAATITFTNAPTNSGSHQIFFAVAGDNGTTSGDYSATVTRSTFP